MKSVAIIGAGITGLTAAFYLKRQGIPVVVYDAAGRAGDLDRDAHKSAESFVQAALDFYREYAQAKAQAEAAALHGA